MDILRDERIDELCDKQDSLKEGSEKYQKNLEEINEIKSKPRSQDY